LADAIATTVAISYGYGQHIWMVLPQNADSLALSGLISVTFSIVGQSLSKVSFALTLLHISTGWQKYLLWTAIILMNIFFGLGAMFFWINCKPLETAWKPTTPGVCWDKWITIKFGIFVSGMALIRLYSSREIRGLTWYPSAAFSGIMDLCFAIFPWTVILGLQMKKKEKFGIAIAMSMGIL
jgi:hypothetical protein